ncbi:MAG TPA: calcium/sodium antiporter [Polyangiales bacterium]|nr:calcium/sodium antiporter [Polyangiales bacterium]
MSGCALSLLRNAGFPLFFGKEVVLLLLYAIIAVVVGFVALVWGADRFVYGAAGLARNLGISRVVVGLTIVAFGTSAPEMLVSGMAAAAGSREMGIGNAVGSNVTNATLVLGAAALAGPLSVHSRLLMREIPVLFLSMALAWWFLWDGDLSRSEGLILFSGLILLIGWISVQSRLEKDDVPRAIGADLDDEIPDSLPAAKAIAQFLFGLAFLLIGSRAVVWGAVGIARGLGVSELVIGLTLVALGTSLPELAASVAAARRNEPDIAVGNVVGSNIFNLLGVLALPGIIAPGAIDRTVIRRDFPIMAGVTILLVLMTMNERNHIGRRGGIALIAAFVVYFLMLFLAPF